MKNTKIMKNEINEMHKKCFYFWGSVKYIIWTHLLNLGQKFI